MVSVAPVLSAGLAGKYGTGLPITLSGWAPRPLRLMTRANMRPVTPVSTGTFTHSLVLGVTGVRLEALAGTAVAPALSPCQPLLKPTSCELRRSLVMVIRPPRLGTSCHIKPLARDISTGLTMKNEAMYSALPFAFFGARSISVMSAFFGSLGSSSPKARPVSVSYVMSWPARVPVASITIRMTRASEGADKASNAATALARTGLCILGSMSDLPCLFVLRDESRPGRRLLRRRAGRCCG